MAEMNLNAGYMDGSVRRYGGDEVKWTPDRMYYVPRYGVDKAASIAGKRLWNKKTS
jgi:hypothetical protein